MTQYFHFTLGPVQSFVAQARRTRDFWSGSFLLSWLSAVAMREVIAQGGEILFPELDPAFAAALTARDKMGPQQGSVPNRFKARWPAAQAPASARFEPEKVVKAVQLAWQALAERVWEQDLAAPDARYHGTPVSRTGLSKTRRLWDGQVQNFWEMAWCLSEDPLENDLLDRRKNWRSHLPPPQAGLKCVLLEGWQELSGAKRRGPPGEREGDSAREQAKKFWRAVAAGDRMGLDLGEKEMLCAIGFIKRRFHRHFHLLQDIEMPSGWLLQGWEIDIAVPSVTYVAAAHWLEEVLQDSKIADAVLEDLHDLGVRLAGGEDDAQSRKPYGEWRTQIRCIQTALATRNDANRRLRRLPRLDGAVWFPDLYGSHFDAASEGIRAAMRRAIAALGHGQPAPFYALLLMDGDSLGKMLSGGADGPPEARRPEQAAARERVITRALAAFTRAVNETVPAHDGFLVYAGGDDVLALLPVEDVLDCAAALRVQYRQSFAQCGAGTLEPPITATISAAVQFIHVHCPLTRVLRDAHHLLEKIAKNGCGRDALAVRVVKPGGMVLQWAMPWEAALGNGELEVVRIARRFQGEQAAESGFSSKFFFGVRDILDKLVDPKETAPGILSHADFKALLWADYLASADNREQTLAHQTEAEADLDALLQQCQPKQRNSAGQPEAKGRLRPDAALLIRFLASKGVTA